MRKAIIKIHDISAGVLTEYDPNRYGFKYDVGYSGPPVSLTMPVISEEYIFERFPPFFDGLLPEGIQLDGLLRTYKIDKYDYFQQLIITGRDLVGAVTADELNDE
ncbi:MAG TPA: HipA N-terminal domain-containing protein [Clostridiales bacterium]|nr:HipA N-terminal domain-containing protein [Clostridiales bacterium]HQP70990.1 HipA N-terminal domain-containing protein [Clostridiales bacterium]